MSELATHQAFTPQRVRRDALLNAPYNPRRMPKDKAKRLRDNLAKVGLVEPVIWNRRTGNLVGGHQRLAALDMLEGKADYELDVAAVDLDPKVEREQNVFLNNPGTQGDWDLRALQGLFAKGASLEGAGFDELELDELLQPLKNVDIALQENRPAMPPQAATVGVDLIIGFVTREQREAFVAALGVEKDERYVDAARIFAKLNVDPTEDWLKAYA